MSQRKTARGEIDGPAQAASRGVQPAVPGKSTLTEQLRGLDGPALPGKQPISAGFSEVRGLHQASNLSAFAVHHGQADGERGLRSGALVERQGVRGIGDTLSDVGDVIGTGVGNVVGGVAGALTGISITQTTTGGPTFGPQGASMYHVGFHTTGRTGWIVQKVDNTLNGTDSTGAALTPTSIGLTPHYYEAWQVDATGAVTPAVGGTNDMWDQGPIGAGSKGHWSTTAALYWVPGAATPAGMAASAVPSAGILVSSTAAPPGLGIARLHRYAHATWDATVTPAVDHGSAGP